jgi:hypothetical protein
MKFGSREPALESPVLAFAGDQTVPKDSSKTVISRPLDVIRRIRLQDVLNAIGITHERISDSADPEIDQITVLLDEP